MICYDLSEPSNRPCRMYFVRTFGEIVDQAWVSGKATYAFEGGQQFEKLPVLRRRGRQKDQGYKYMVMSAIPFLLFCNSSS